MGKQLGLADGLWKIIQETRLSTPAPGTLKARRVTEQLIWFTSVYIQCLELSMYKSKMQKCTLFLESPGIPGGHINSSLEFLGIFRDPIISLVGIDMLFRYVGIEIC